MIFSVNPWAVLLAAFSSFVLGSVWYGFLFQQLWCRETGIDPERPPPLLRTFGGAFALSVVSALVFSYLLGPSPGLTTALTTGLLAGLGWVAASFGINYLFSRRSLKLFMLDGGYHTLQFTLYGLVFGAWPNL